MHSLVATIFCSLMLAACQPKITDAYFVSVPVEQIGPKNNEDYETWSTNTFSLLKKSVGFYCLENTKLTLAAKSRKNAEVLSQRFNTTSPVKHNFKSYADKLNCEIQDGHTIRINLTKPLYGAGNALVESQTKQLGLFELTTEVEIGDDPKKYADGAFELIYPKSYRYIQEDAKLRLNILRKKFGSDCCQISEQSPD